MLTDTDYQNLILAETGAALATAEENGAQADYAELQNAYEVVASTLATTIWVMYTAQGALAPRLQYLYARRHCAQIIHVAMALAVDYEEGGKSERLSQRADELYKLISDTNEEIALLQSQVNSRLSASGVMGGLQTPAFLPGSYPLRPWGLFGFPFWP